MMDDKSKRERDEEEKEIRQTEMSHIWVIALRRIAKGGLNF